MVIYERAPSKQDFSLGQHGLRKHPKTAEICKKSKIGIFHQFFDVFSAQDDRIEF